MDDIADRYAEQLTAGANSWTSIEVEAVTQLSFGDPSAFPGPVARELRTTYIETDDGERFQELRARLVDGSENFAGHAYSDGIRCASVSYHKDDPSRQRLIRISGSFSGEAMGLSSQRPLPLRFLHVGLKPLPEALREGAQHLGQAETLDRPCEVFLFRDVPLAVGKVMVRYSLDRESGVPLAIQWFKDEGALVADNPYRTWQATKFETRDGVPLVVQDQELTFRDGSTKPFDEISTKVVRVEFNKEYPATTFWPVPQPGVTIHDTLRRTRETVPGGPPPGATATAGTNIRADGAPGWDPAQGAMIGLGVALVAVAGWLWWRNR
jgi:hypothetical protein